MADRTERIITCDQCNQESTDDGGMWSGGYLVNGYYTVTNPCRKGLKFSTHVYHFCSVKCLQEYKFKEE